MTQALFYPWVDIIDETWLKTSLLYWDTVRTIVPASIGRPYSTETGNALYQAGFLLPLRVQSEMEEIRALVPDVRTYMESNEGIHFFVASPYGQSSQIHQEKLPTQFRRTADMYPEKLPSVIRDMLNYTAAETGGEVRVEERFSLFYMTLLANRLAERIGASLLTSLSMADELALATRHDAQPSWSILSGGYDLSPRRHEYEADGPRVPMPKELASGLLAQLAIERIAIAPDTPVDRLMEFRERYRDELSRFRTAIENLAAGVATDLPVEALRRIVKDLYRDAVSPAVADLKSALDGRKIRWLSEGLLKTAFMATGPSAMLAVGGLDVPTALLAGAGVSLIASSAIYNVEKRDYLRQNPYSYLLSMARELK